MKNLKILASLCLASTLSLNSARASCERDYQGWIAAHQANAGDVSGWVIPGITAVGVASASSPIFGAAASSTIGTIWAAETDDVSAARKALAVVVQARSGDGMDLRDLHEELTSQEDERLSGLSLDALSKIINDANNEAKLCSISYGMPYYFGSVVDYCGLQKFVTQSVTGAEMKKDCRSVAVQAVEGGFGVVRSMSTTLN